MQLDPNPFFRKPITPWYDGAVVCWATIVFAVAGLAFAMVGIIVVTTQSTFRSHLWFPVVLAGLNLVLAIKIIVRMTRRKKNS